MDYAGLKSAEQWISRILLAFAAVGFLAGYVSSNFALMAYINLAGLVVALLVVVPDWPCFNRQPLQWLPPLNPGKASERGTKEDEDGSSQQEQLQLLAPERPTRSSSRKA